jgi:two-component system nitrogen regulation response regulator GlnG
MRELIASTLLLEGFSVTQAKSGEELLRLVDAGPTPDLVITDVNMPPGIDGIAVLSHLRSHHPNLPVILMSAFVTPRLRARAAQSGPAAALLSKPFRLDDLRAEAARHGSAAWP